MKIARRLLFWGLVVAAAFAVTGCMSTIDAVAGLISDMDNAVAESVNEEREASAGMFGELAALEQTMLFNVAYFQVFFMGGFGPEFDDFREGEGVTWEVTGSDEDDAESFITERALLKRVDEGSWWYLSYGDGEEELEYEVLLDDEYAPVEMVWLDEDSEEVMRYTFDFDEDEESADEMAKGKDSEVYSDEFGDDYKRSTDRVTVGAGTFTAELLETELSDPDTGETLAYSWWVVEDVPGNLVKYEYHHSDDDSRLVGELMSIDKGYRTQFDAY